MKRFLYYFAWTIAIGLILYGGVRYQFRLQKEASETFNILPVYLFAGLFPVFLGMLLRLPKLIWEIKEKKAWTFDWIKVVAVALPALYIALLPALLATPFGVHLPLSGMQVWLANAIFMTTAGIVAGYVLLDSVKKQ